MNESPPGNEKPTGKGGLLTDSAFTISETQPDCNSKIKSVESMPDDVGYYFDADGHRHFEPCVMPEQEAEPLSKEQGILLTIGTGCAFAAGHPGRWAAWLHVTRYDLRTTADIAESLKISQRSFQLYCKSARACLANLRAELESEDAP